MQVTRVIFPPFCALCCRIHAFVRLDFPLVPRVRAQRRVLSPSTLKSSAVSHGVWDLEP